MKLTELIEILIELQSKECGELPVCHSFNEILSVEVDNDVTGKPVSIRLKGFEE